MSKVYLFVEIDIKAGMREAFIEKLLTHAANMRSEDGCESLELLRDTQNEDKVCVWEIWRDRASWDVHMDNDASKAWRPIAAQFVNGETISVMDAI